MNFSLTHERLWLLLTSLFAVYFIINAAGLWLTMAALSTHPTTAKLFEFLSGVVKPEERPELESHLWNCQVCFKAMQNIPECKMLLIAREAVFRTSVSDDTPFPVELRRPLT